MRVLHVVGNLDPDSGGSTSAAFHTSGYLRTHGVDAELAGTWQGPEAAGYIAEQWPDLPVHGFRRQPPHHYWHSPALRHWLAANTARFDLVVVNGVFKFPFVDAARVARRNRVPYLLQPHGSLDPYDLNKHRLAKRAYGALVVRRLITHSAGVLVTSERERRQLVTYGVPAPVNVLPLPVAGPSTAGHGGRFRQSFDITDTAPVVLFLSRVDPKKGLERLLEATRTLLSTRPDLKLVIVGASEDPAYGDTLRHRADELGVGDSVVWAGLLLGDEKWDAFAGSDLFVLPSDYENFGIVVVEALLAERPVVISDGVYISEDLAATGGAYVCKKDVRSLITTIDEVLTNTSEARSTAARGKEAVESTFAPDAATASTIAVYRDVVSRRTHTRADI